ncbi:hypothetical protein ACQEVB_03075 [Pseudonocardia sp. CA-107938]|uniref:hypothetical protein n=1 Tax=Pseudonocardia sp. CA-107938 TaxID=3240021 RepID=UPI003D8FCAAC
MEIVVLVVLVLELVVGVLLVMSVRRVRARMRAVEAAQQELEAELAGIPSGGALNPLLSVEILNAAELAARESWAARRFGALVPRLVVREVAARAATQMSRQLGAQGVEAEVKVVAPVLPAKPQ